MAVRNSITGERKSYVNYLIDIHGKIQSLKRLGHKSLGALPSNQLSYHSSMEAPFLTIFEEHDLNDGRMCVTPAQKKDLCLGGV